MIFGSMKRAKIASEINEQKWSELIKNGMEVIEDYKFTLKNKTQHIDVFEIECNTPLFANVYYNEKDQEFSDLTVGDVAIQYIDPKNTATITIDTTTISGIFYYSISAFNPQGNPDLTFNFSAKSFPFPQKRKIFFKKMYQQKFRESRVPSKEFIRSVSQ